MGGSAKKFGDDIVGIFFLESLNKSGYIVTRDLNGMWMSFDEKFIKIDHRFEAFVTSKTKALFGSRRLDFYKWLIPTIFSFVALVVSIIAITK